MVIGAERKMGSGLRVRGFVCRKTTEPNPYRVVELLPTGKTDGLTELGEEDLLSVLRAIWITNFTAISSIYYDSESIQFRNLDLISQALCASEVIEAWKEVSTGIFPLQTLKDHFLPRDATMEQLQNLHLQLVGFAQAVKKGR